MKSLLEKVSSIDGLIRDMHKMESRMRSGQWIDAWRETNRIIAYLEKEKMSLIVDEEQKNAK